MAAKRTSNRSKGSAAARKGAKTGAGPKSKTAKAAKPAAPHRGGHSKAATKKGSVPALSKKDASKKAVPKNAASKKAAAPKAAQAPKKSAPAGKPAPKAPPPKPSKAPAAKSVKPAPKATPSKSAPAAPAARKALPPPPRNDRAHQGEDPIRLVPAGSTSSRGSVGLGPARPSSSAAAARGSKPSGAAPARGGSERPSSKNPPPSKGSSAPSRAPSPNAVTLAPRTSGGVMLVRRSTERPSPSAAAAQAAPLPIPVRKLESMPSVEERYASIEKRLGALPAEFQKRYFDNFDMSWIYHDSALEGVVYTLEELKAGLASEPIVTDSSLQPAADEIRRHKEAIEFVRDFGQKKRLPVTIDTVKKIYLILHPSEGDLKTVKYRKDIPQHRLYFHEYTAPDKIAYKVRQVVDWVNEPETKKKGALRISARAHYDLVRVFPFATDSGKVARLFMNLLLYRAGYPPAIIHSTERQRYYDALKGSSPVIQSMVQEAVENALTSVEKLLDEHETKTRAFIN
jgi:Fic family protein